MKMRMMLKSALCFVLVPILAAQQATTAVTVPQNTRIDLVTLETLSTESAKRGAQVRFAVAHDVTINGVTVIPAGTPVTGVVTKAERGIAYQEWPTLRIHVKEVRMNRSIGVPLSQWSLGTYHESWNERVQCAVFFVVCLSLKKLENDGWGEDGPPKPDQSSSWQAVLPRCVAIDFWTTSATTVYRSDMPSEMAASNVTKIDCPQFVGWSDSYLDPGLGRVFFR